MLSSGSLGAATRALLLGLLFSYTGAALAQEHGNHAPPITLTRPDAVDEKDSLKDFHQALAVQATRQQIAEFQTLLKKTDAAKAELQKFIQSSHQDAAPATKAANSMIDEALESARSETKEFLGSFSDEQKLGLKEQLRLLDRGDTMLADQEKKLDQALQNSPSSSVDLANYATNLDKALADFSSQQLALAREMSIVPPTAHDVTFNIPAVKSKINVAGQPVEVTVSSVLFQTATEAGKRTFRLEIIGDLTDFQQNINDVLRAQLDSENPCGERVELRRAMLMPSPPASNLNLQLHYERWACLRLAGQTTPNELAESDGTVEISVLPEIASSGSLQVKTEFGRINASGMMGDAIRTGDLGADLREKIARAFLVALQTTTDLKTALPSALQGSATLQSASFADNGAGVLSIRLQGEAQISDEGAKSLASQLNQSPSAPAPGSAPAQ